MDKKNNIAWKEKFDSAVYKTLPSYKRWDPGLLSEDSTVNIN